MTSHPIQLADIEQAALRIQGHAVETPLLEFHSLNEQCQGRVLVKPEVLQRTGSFKFRGAYNTLASLSPEERARGVLAFSSGNHAQGVACAAKLLGIRATILMPKDAPALKIRRTREYGAQVVLFDRETEDREAIAATLTAESGAVLVKPYDDPRVMAGQGTLGLEIARQAEALGLRPDVALVPCGGGGLIAGVSVALHSRFPEIAVYAVEPEGFDDTGRSLAAGSRQSIAPGGHSICDAILTASPGELTFEINRRLLRGALTVTDAEVRFALRWAFENLKLVVEPGGVVGLAALLAGRIALEGRCAVIVLSGGNADPALFANALLTND